MQHRSSPIGRIAARAVTLITLLGCASGAHAIPIGAGGSTILSGTTAAARPELAGSIIYDHAIPYQITDPNGTVIASGNFQDRVIRETSSGTLDFYFSVTNSPNSTSALSLVNRADYGPVTTDVDWRSDGLGTIAPYNATRSALADSVSIAFAGPGGPVNPGSTSRAIFIRTNAKTYVTNGITTLQSRLVTGAPGGTVRFATAEPDPAAVVQTYHFFQLLPTDLTDAQVDRLAEGQKLRQIQSDAKSRMRVFVDADGSVRLLHNPQTGDLHFTPNLAAKLGDPPAIQTADRLGVNFLQQYALLPAVRFGSIFPGEVITLANGVGLKAGDKPVGHDVLRTVHFYRQIDGLRVTGPDSRLSVDVSSQGAVGLSRTIRPLSVVRQLVNWKPLAQAMDEFSTQYRPVLIGLLRNDPGTKAAFASRDLVYFEQGAGFVQPAYRFQVEFTSSNGAKSGQTFIIPAATNSPEAVTNTTINNNPATEPVARGTTGFAPNAATINYGIYVVRNDNRFLDDAWRFHTNIEAANSLYSFFGFGFYAPVHFNQYYWDHPWLWENDPAEGIGDNSPSFVGQNEIDLYEGHGAPWLVTTLSNNGDLIDYRTLPGYGGNNGVQGKTAYIIWHTCDSIPVPGDAYGGFYQSPAGPFDTWFHVFRGLRGTYGARTTVDIYNNAGPAFATLTGFGIPNLNAWFNVESNAVTGHGGGWDYGSAVILSGHENDCIYDNAPGPNAGSLTLWWQHP